MDLTKINQEWGRPRAGLSVDGKPLTIKGQVFERGVGTHAYSEMWIDLKGSAETFVTFVGVDDEGARPGSVQFRVFVDGVKKADSGLMKTGDEPKQLLVELKGAKELLLVVEDGGDGIDYDHADWADAKITVQLGKPKPAAKAAPVEPPMKIYRVVHDRPEIHGPRVVGFSPNKPFLFRIPATGLSANRSGAKFEVTGLPEGLHCDPATGIIQGKVSRAGEYSVQIKALGSGGRSDTREIRLVCGEDKLALTPPMGWNSWNIWGTSVTADRVRAAADSLVKSGLADYGYQYVNIDDAWEGKRDENGVLQTNEKFGDMKALADYVHGMGLKLGIYSSPGPKTCAGYEGSYQHERIDAETYARWGIDYLKHDWCSYGQLAPQPTLEQMKEPYFVMDKALKSVDRDIVYSLCQYGMGDVYKWGDEVGGHLWRTTGDITDTWQSMAGIGFSHGERSPYAGPGGWNDPDMLVVGMVGWSNNPRPTRLTPNEQITHITLWAMLAAPLILGCDLTQLDDFTKDLLMNHDVIEIDQDPLGKAAVPVLKQGEVEVWARPLWDGTVAVALFNRGRKAAPITVSFDELGLDPGTHEVRDLWLRKDLGTKSRELIESVPGHGARLFRIGQIRK